MKIYGTQLFSTADILNLVLVADNSSNASALSSFNSKNTNSSSLFLERKISDIVNSSSIMLHKKGYMKYANAHLINFKSANLFSKSAFKSCAIFFSSHGKWWNILFLRSWLKRRSLASKLKIISDKSKTFFILSLLRKIQALQMLHHTGKEH